MLGQHDSSVLTAQLLLGDARHLPLDAESVHCVITSPPYWSLRDYGLTPLVWDDAGIGCPHQWVPAGTMTKRGAPIATSLGYEKGAARLHVAKVGEFCTQCPAWRGTLGLEPSVDLYIKHLVEVFEEVKRVLRNDGLCFLNIGDCYDSKTKQRWLVPHRLALALQGRGWIVRSDIIWAKGISFVPSYAGSVMPESVRDRPTCAHEHILMLAKEAKYFYDYEAIREPGIVPLGTRAGKGSGTREGNRRPPEYAVYDGRRNPRDVWAIGTRGYRGAHFATFPPKLVEPLLRAGTSAYVCSACGTPYSHVVSRSPVPLDVKEQMELARRASAARTGRSDGHTHPRGYAAHARAILADAYQRTCSCPNGAAGLAVVLDPFMGSGTVGLVAKQWGRRFIGIDAQPSYLQLAAVRLRSARWRDHADAEGVGGLQEVAGAERPDRRGLDAGSVKSSGDSGATPGSGVHLEGLCLHDESILGSTEGYGHGV